MEFNNLQEVFEAAVNGILLQGRYAVEEVKEGHPFCFYRDNRYVGVKCAVGVLIPDEMYPTIQDEAQKEGAGLSGYGNIQCGASTLYAASPSLRALLPFDNVSDLLETLQHAHDECASQGQDLKRFKEICNAFASNYGLRPVA